MLIKIMSKDSVDSYPNKISIKTINTSRRNLFEKASENVIRFSLSARDNVRSFVSDERGDVPGWVLIVLMTTGLVTGIWAIAKPNLTSILQNSLNSMNGIR